MVTVGIVNWYLIFPAIIIAIFVVYIRGIYIKSARDIKRFEGLGKFEVLIATIVYLIYLCSFQSEVQFIHM